MASKYTVTVSLDEVTKMMWEELPIGERSKRVRAAIKTASLVSEKDMLIGALRKRDDSNKRTIEDMRLFCRCGAIKGGGGASD